MTLEKIKSRTKVPNIHNNIFISSKINIFLKNNLLVYKDKTQKCIAAMANAFIYLLIKLRLSHFETFLNFSD